MVRVSACVRIKVRVSVRIRVRLWIRILFRHTITSGSSTVGIPSSHDPLICQLKIEKGTGAKVMFETKVITQ